MSERTYKQRFEIVVTRVRRFRWEWSVTETGPVYSVRRGWSYTRTGARDAALIAADRVSCLSPIREEFAFVKLRNGRTITYPEPIPAVALHPAQSDGGEGA